MVSQNDPAPTKKLENNQRLHFDIHSRFLLHKIHLDLGHVC
jgi:hypothetical protein